MVVINRWLALHGYQSLYFLSALGLIVAPILLVAYPPLLDYPSQLARTFITLNIASFSDFYVLNPSVPPNIAGELLIGFFARFFPIETAGKLFIVFTLLVQVTGVSALHYALWGRAELALPAIMAAFFVFGWTLDMGFLNYLFAIGLMLWGLATLLLAGRLSMTKRMLLAFLIAVLLAFAHIVALVLLMVILYTYQLQRAWISRSWRTLFAESDIHAPLLFVLAGFLATGVAVENQPMQWREEWQYKLRQLFHAMDLGLTNGWISLAVLLLFAAALFYTARLRVRTDMLLAIGMLLVVFLAAPHKMAGGAYLDARIPTAIILVAIACVRLDFRSDRRRHGFLMLLFTLLTLRMTYQVVDYAKHDADARDIIDALSAVQANSVVVVAVDGTSERAVVPIRERRLWHAADLAALHQPLFVLTTHALRFQHTILCRDLWQPWYASLGNVPQLLAVEADIESMLQQLRRAVDRAESELTGRRFPAYVLLLHPNELAPSMSLRGRRVATDRHFLLLQILP